MVRPQLRVAKRVPWATLTEPLISYLHRQAATVCASSRAVTARWTATLPVLGAMSPRFERWITIGSVAVVHLILAGIFLSTAPIRTAPVEQTLVLVGGPLAPATAKPALPPPAMISPDAAVVLPPDIVLDTTIELTAPSQPIAGSPTVTRPAEAVPGAHAPAILPAYLRQEDASVRLVLSISSDGAVTDAVVQATSGTRLVDQIAIDWVKSHWRYAPALKGGLPVIESTTAVVTFVR